MALAVGVYIFSIFGIIYLWIKMKTDLSYNLIKSCRK